MDDISKTDDYTSTTLLVVDDHELVVRGISAILERAFPAANILTALTGEDAIALLKTRRVDLITIDLELPDMSGFTLIDYVRASHPDTKILVNTIHDEIWTVKRLNDRAVEGIIFKSARAENFVNAVKTLLSSATFYDNGARQLMKLISSQRARVSNLSMREIEVLQLIADGLNTEEIAARLGVKPNTIETHRRHLLDKLGVRNSAELVRTAISSGILSLMK